MRDAFVVSGNIHFVGIGGIGMSGIAEVLRTARYKVTGSDVVDNAHVKRLRAQGIPVAIGHAPQNVFAAEVVVISSAIPRDNAEVVWARENGIPVIRRADMLGEIMGLKKSICIAGTHGKTTTTSLSAALLEAAGYDPTVVNGGIVNSSGTNARLGQGAWFVAEADESDGSFLRLPATIGVVTNIDPEHMEHYGTFPNLVEAFRQFLDRLPFYGLAVLCVDHPVVKEIYEALTDRRKVSYGLHPGAVIRAVNIRMDASGSVFDLEIDENNVFVRHHHFTPADWKNLMDLRLPLYGHHNVQNALSLVAIAAEIGISPGVLRETLAQFKGVKRRFTKVGTVAGITVIDDYAHHPVEIGAVLKAAKSINPKKIIAVVQPHRYTRLSRLFEGFVESLALADNIIVCPVYGAGEKEIPGATHESFAKALEAKYPGKAIFSIFQEEALAPLVQQCARDEAMVLCMGAGSITYWAQALPEKLERLFADHPCCHDL